MKLVSALWQCLIEWGLVTALGAVVLGTVMGAQSGQGTHKVVWTQGGITGLAVPIWRVIDVNGE